MMSDLEDGRGTRNPPMVFTQASVGNSTNNNNNNHPAVSSGWVHHDSTTGTVAPPAIIAIAAARDGQHHRDNNNSFSGRSAPQDFAGADSLAPDPTAPQHNSSTGIPPGTRAPGGKRRMAMGSKSSNKQKGEQKQQQQQQQQQQARASLVLANTSFYTVSYSVRRGDNKTQHHQGGDNMTNSERSIGVSTTSSVGWSGAAVSASADPQRKFGNSNGSKVKSAVEKLLDKLDREDFGESGRTEVDVGNVTLLRDFRMAPMGRTQEHEVLFPADCDLLLVRGYYWDSVSKDWQKFKDEVYSIVGWQTGAEKKFFSVMASASDFKTRTRAPAPEMKSDFQSEAEQKAAQLAAEEVKWEAEERLRLEQGAPIRGLAKRMSRMDIRRKVSTSGHNSRNPNRGSDVPKLSSWLSETSRRLSRAEAPPPIGAEAITAATPGFALPPLGTGPRIDNSEIVSRSGANLAGNPDTPPPLQGVNRKRSLLNRGPREGAPEMIDQEVMIGEIQSIHLDAELAIATKALVIIGLGYVIAFVLWFFGGRLSPDLNVFMIAGFVSVLLLSYPAIRLVARLFAYVLTTWAPGMLYRGNRYYFLVALHHDIAMVIWSGFLVIFWMELFYKWVYPEESHDARSVYTNCSSILLAHLALRVGILLKNFLVLLVATYYLWIPYLERVQSNILAQYILLLLTDYSLKGTCNPDDQKFALEMVRQGHENTKKISLYAVSKAMGFIPRHKLEHSFFRHLAGSDTLDSTRDATIIGNYLFDKLILRSRPEINPWVAAATAIAGKEHGKQRTSTKFVGQSSGDSVAQPGWYGESSIRSHPIASTASLSSEEGRLRLVSAGGGSSRNFGGGGGGDHDGGKNYPVTNIASNKVTSGFNKIKAASAQAFAPSFGSGAGGGGNGADETSGSEHQMRGDHNSVVAQVMPIPEEYEDDAREGGGENAGGKDRNGVKYVQKEAPGVSGGPTEEEEEEEEEEETGPEEVLVKETLCPPLGEDLINLAFSHFDEDNSGTVTREEMVIGVVRAFEDHRSLSSTLQDSEHIARKLGLIITAAISFVLIFVWLGIWGTDAFSLGAGFGGTLVTLSFVFGTAASNLMSSVLFVFVSRVYDVGDRVHIYDGMTGTAMKDMTVTKVDLMTTHFKRWDEMMFYMPNHMVAEKTIVNIQRSAHQWHEFFIQVAVTTPSSKLKSLNASLLAFCKKKDKAEGLYPTLGFALASIENTNTLSIRLTFRQRGNWQEMEKKWAVQSMCTWAIKNACESIGIVYTMPEVPVNIKKQKLV